MENGDHQPVAGLQSYEFCQFLPEIDMPHPVLRWCLFMSSHCGLLVLKANASDLVGVLVE